MTEQSERKLPRRPRAHVLETLSTQHVKSILPAEWICTTVQHDYGLDMRVEIVVDEQVTGLEFSIQLKATDNLKTSGNHIIHSCEVSTANYWLHRFEPVMYVVYDAQRGTAYWLWVQPYFQQLDQTKSDWRDKKSVRIRIPCANMLTVESIPMIMSYVQASRARIVPLDGWEYAISPQTARRPFQVPHDLPTFTGRAEYLAKLDELLRPSAGLTVALVGLRGMGGVGKSVMVVHAAHCWGDRFRDGVVWVDLRSQDQDVNSALRHIAATYGYDKQVAQVVSLEGLAKLVRTVLRGREALIILDNAESVPPDQFSLLLPATSECVTLVTSRRSFTELDRYGHVLRVGRMVEEEAKALLARILGSVTSEAEDLARSRLIERLGGLPLALDIAAQRMAEQDWGAAEYIARLERGANLIAELRLPLASRYEESIALNFALSYRVLNERQQRLFRALGAMAEGGFAPASVGGVLGEESVDIEYRLEDLVALSLVQPGKMPTRYELHPLLAEYSRTLAHEAGEWERFRSAHMRYYLEYAGRYASDYRALEAEQPNILQALDWAYHTWQQAPLPEDLANRVIRVVAGSARFLGYRGNLRGRVDWGKRALEIAEQTGSVSDAAELCASTIAWPLLMQGDYTRAREYASKGLELAQQCNITKWAGYAARILSGVARDQKQESEAKQWADKARYFARQTDDIGLQRGADLDVAYATLLGHDYVGAEEQFRSLLKLVEKEQDKERTANRSGDVALALINQGRMEEARELYEYELALGEELGNEIIVGEAEFGLARIEQICGDPSRAEELMSSARRRFESLGITRLGRAQQFIFIDPVAASAS